MRAFKGLRGRATAATIAIVFVIVANVAFDSASFAFADGADENAVELFGTVSVLLIVGLLVTGVVFLMWLNAAAWNLRVLRPEATFQTTPGWAVGWWFVPFANLVRPYRAVREIWIVTAELVGEGEAAASASVLPFWWAAWLASGFVGNASGRIDDPHASAAVGAVATLFTIAAGAMLIHIVRTVTERQTEAASQGDRARALRETLQHAADRGADDGR